MLAAHLTHRGCEKIDRHKPVAFARRPFFWTTAPVEEAVEVQLRRSWLALLASVVVHSIAHLR